jgi:hypothetical protein
MTPDRAYDTLEIPNDTDEAMLLMVFGVRIEEQPSQIDKMREALSVIAEVRDSARLRQFLETGQDRKFNDMSSPFTIFADSYYSWGSHCTHTPGITPRSQSTWQYMLPQFFVAVFLHHQRVARGCGSYGQC